MPINDPWFVSSIYCTEIVTYYEGDLVLQHESGRIIGSLWDGKIVRFEDNKKAEAAYYKKKKRTLKETLFKSLNNNYCEDDYKKEKIKIRLRNKILKRENEEYKNLMYKIWQLPNELQIEILSYVDNGRLCALFPFFPNEYLIKHVLKLRCTLFPPFFPNNYLVNHILKN